MKNINARLVSKLAVLAITLLGLAVRVHSLTYHSLWFDEAVSVNWARQGVPRIVEVSMNLVEDKLPPLYYLLLHFWVREAGFGEFALRFLSVLFGVLLIALVYRLGLEICGRRAGLVGAALAAVNPFLVWYSQEVRMYALAAFLAVATTFCFIKALREEERAAAYWAGYVLGAVAGLYTHLFTGFLLPAQALFFLASWRRYGRQWLRFGAALLAVTLLFAPLAWANWQASSEAGPGDPLAGLGGRLWLLLTEFTTYRAQVSPVIVALLGLLALLGLAAPFFSGADGGTRREGALCLALGIAIPIAVAEALLLRSRLMFYGSRYFIVVTPFLVLAIAAGVERASRRHLALGGVALLFAFGALLGSLPANWTPESRKEEWRATADYLAAHARPADAIIIHPDFVRLPFQYYERGPGHAYALFSGPLSDEAQIEPTMQYVVERHPVVWLVQSHTETPDPQRIVERWLAARYPIISEQYPPGVSTKGYAIAYRLAHLPPEAHPVEAQFAGQVRLAGYNLDGERFRAVDDLYHPPSGWIHVTLYWRAGDEQPAADYTAFVHLIDDWGQVWGAQLDRPSGAMRFYPPARWQADQVIRDDYDVNLNPATPPGVYHLVVGLLSPGGEQVTALVGDAAAVQVVLGDVQIK